ncbi:GntR family transcriptional regulator [Kibdelosporangium aridum]|uniref:GntR family transcriptional regulator n=1 Tax=Kibdelosporangium aridum TaxID=2030 RepID=A0A1Y5XTT1_KIBAR|nr:GntR family transcriptional regulator [Kibdelosporangium aridum]SMD14114.1 GntR family transcriptional regulator [Kibdelosporangium aridum]
MADPAYVTIAGEYARKIRGGELPPGVQLPSYAELATRHGVSDAVVRKFLDLLQGQGLIRKVPRRGIFVADRPNLIHISPERQMESPETTFGNESGQAIKVDRVSGLVRANDEIAGILDVAPGDAISHVVTRASEDGRPISISDTYQPMDVTGIEDATDLEHKYADKIPVPAHAEWLKTPSGELVKTIHQRFITADGRVIMVSDVSYPWNRYEAFVCRMKLR